MNIKNNYMLPWWHLATSLIVSYILVASLGLNITTGISWIVVGSFFGAFIDNYLELKFLSFSPNL